MHFKILRMVRTNISWPEFLLRHLHLYLKSYEFLFCLGQTSWPHGSSLINYMKLMQFNGLSGLVQFDSQGVRTDFDLDVMELQVNDFQKVFFLLT